MINLYIAGPMTGEPDYNSRNFMLAAGHLRAVLGFDRVMAAHTANAPRGLSHARYMVWSFEFLDNCDAIVLLDGWERSEGAKMEYERARQQGKPVFYMPMKRNRYCMPNALVEWVEGKAK